MTDHILAELRGATLLLTLQRPDKKNALTHAMYGELARQLNEAATRPEVRSVVLWGSEDFFTTGNDLQDFMAGLKGRFDEIPVGQFIAAMIDFPKPLIAAINGLAIGIGTTLLLHCDGAVAGTNAKFQMPFAALGLCPEAGSTVLFPRLAGHLQAMRYLVLGEAFDAERAEKLELVNEVVPPEHTLDAALKLAERYNALPAAAVRASKALLRDHEKQYLKDVVLREGTLFIERLNSPEAQEAFAAFAEKRAPDFTRFD